MLLIKGYEIIQTRYQEKGYNFFHAIRLSDKQPVIIKAHAEEVPTTKCYRDLLREFEIGKALNHPNIIKCYSLEKAGHRLALVMEYFDGVALAKHIPPQGIPLLDFLTLALQLTKAIGAIHLQQIIYQAITPDNILIDLNYHCVKLINFTAASRLVYETQLPMTSSNICSTQLAYVSPEQTGRMNRTIDYHTDFYSLGIVFYQMLCGHLPFAADDPIDLIYCHIARMPKFPYEEKPEVPRVVFAIIEKLLAKNVEDRYQSAYGLEADLQACFNQLIAKGTIQNFSIGQQDAFDRFYIHQKMYGREIEIQQLCNTFNDISKGKIDNALLLVHGYSGVGKTTLINEIQKPLLQARANFISGKCDQFERNVPYAAFIQALKQLIRQLLTESEEKLGEWKTRLLKSVGPNGQIMIDVIPELEIIIGSQPPVVELAPIESQGRFQHVFRNFMAVFSQPTHPLVIFLDDLQWANLSALNLIKLIMLHPDTHYLYLIGAYRDNEVDENHPLIQLLNEIRQQKFIHDIALKPLSFTHINQLIADALHTSLAAAKSLAELVYAKTDGNPFFTNQFLMALYQAKMLRFNGIQQRWEWNIQGIQAMNITNNVVDLMVEKIHLLPMLTQTALSLAANISYRFDLDILAIISEMSLENTSNALWPAVQIGLIIPSDKNYYEAAEYNQRFRFLHDRVQQAAASLISAQQRQPLQLKIGRLLLEKTPSEQLEGKLFYIVGQLNAGRELITDEQERIKLAELNLKLAKKAKDSTAYISAVQHAKSGVELLPSESWKTHYDLSLALYKQLAESHYLAGYFAEAEKIYPLMLKAAQSDFDKISIYFIKMNQLELQGRYREAIQIMLDGLALLGIHFPNNDMQLEMILAEELAQITVNLRGRKPKELIEAPEISDPQVIIIMKLLTGLWAPGFILNLQNLLMMISVKMANLSLRYGNCEATSIAYAQYSYYAGFLTGNYKEAYAFGEVGIKLSHHYNNLSIRCKVYFIFGHGTSIWRKSLKNSYSYLDQCYALGIESGNLAYASYVINFILTYRFMQGMELTALNELSTHYLGFLKRTNPAMFDFATALTQPIRDLIGSDKCFDDEDYLKTYFQMNLFESAYLVGKIITAYLLEDKKNGLVYADKVVDIVPIGLRGIFLVVEAEFYAALIYLSAYATMQPDKQQQYLSKINTILSHMKIWTNNCAANCLHKLLLIEAEKARIQEKSMEHVVALYERAIIVTQQYDFIQYEALANELYAKYLLEKNEEKPASSYLKNAYQLYSRWGAKVKIERLENAYPQLLKNTVAFSSIKSQAFDLKTVMKAVQTISSEINLDKLLATIMKAILENAGAQKGAILLLDKDGLLTVEAECHQQGGAITTLQAVPIVDWQGGAHSIVQYVKRTKQLAIIGTAINDPQFSSDPYIIKLQPKSILCMPIIMQNKMKGLLYLENNLAVYAFTPNHIEVLNILASQIAISLENVRYFEQLAEETARTQKALKQVEEKERQRELALKSANMGIWKLNFQDNTVVADDRILALYGVTRENFDFTYENFVAVYHPDDRIRVRQAIERAVEEYAPFEVEFRVIKPSDHSVHILAGRADVVRDTQGRPEYMIGVNWDITQQKQLEEERLLTAVLKVSQAIQSGTLFHELAKIGQDWEITKSELLGRVDPYPRSIPSTSETAEITLGHMKGLVEYRDILDHAIYQQAVKTLFPPSHYEIITTQSEGSIEMNQKGSYQFKSTGYTFIVYKRADPASLIRPRCEIKIDAPGSRALTSDIDTSIYVTGINGAHPLDLSFADPAVRDKGPDYNGRVRNQIIAHFHRLSEESHHMTSSVSRDSNVYADTITDDENEYLKFNFTEDNNPTINGKPVIKDPLFYARYKFAKHQHEQAASIISLRRALMAEEWELFKTQVITELQNTLKRIYHDNRQENYFRSAEADLKQIFSLAEMFYQEAEQILNHKIAQLKKERVEYWASSPFCKSPERLTLDRQISAMNTLYVDYLEKVTDIHNDIIDLRKKQQDFVIQLEKLHAQKNAAKTKLEDMNPENEQYSFAQQTYATLAQDIEIMKQQLLTILTQKADKLLQKQIFQIKANLFAYGAYISHSAIYHIIKGMLYNKGKIKLSKQTIMGSALQQIGFRLHHANQLRREHKSEGEIAYCCAKYGQRFFDLLFNDGENIIKQTPYPEEQIEMLASGYLDNSLNILARLKAPKLQDIVHHFFTIEECHLINSEMKIIAQVKRESHIPEKEKPEKAHALLKERMHLINKEAYPSQEEITDEDVKIFTKTTEKNLFISVLVKLIATVYSAKLELKNGQLWGQIEPAVQRSTQLVASTSTNAPSLSTFFTTSPQANTNSFWFNAGINKQTQEVVNSDDQSLESELLSTLRK